MQSNSSFSIHCNNVEILIILEMINTKPMITNKLTELLSGLKKFKVQTILVLHYKKRNDCKIFQSSAKLITSDSDINEAFACYKPLWQK